MDPPVGSPHIVIHQLHAVQHLPLLPGDRPAKPLPRGRRLRGHGGLVAGWIAALVAVIIVGMSGAVLAGRVHAHIAFTDDRAALGGHLEEGCRVLTFAVAVLGVLDTDADLSAWDRWEA